MAFRSKGSTTHVTSHFFVTPNEAAPIFYMAPIERPACDPPPKRWTPLLSSFWSRKVFYGYGTSSIHGRI